MSVRVSARVHATVATIAATINTDGHAPIANASRCETTNAPKPTHASVTAVRVPCRRRHARMHHSPPIASTTPPSGREPLPTATA